MACLHTYGWFFFLRFVSSFILKLLDCTKTSCFRIRKCFMEWRYFLTFKRPITLSYRNQSIDLQSTSIGWFLYALVIKHVTSQNQPKPAKTTYNQPKPPTTSHKHPQLAKTTHNSLNCLKRTKGTHYPNSPQTRSISKVLYWSM